MTRGQRARTRLDALERRFTGPKRLGLFGHRAVGKTTLLAMFYREASAGRVPGLRLAAADTATAEYLGSRINRLEAGEPPAGTLAETELHLRLYHDQAKLPLIIKDYQGEHVGLDSDAPIHDFFADCDAVFLCLDPETTTNPPDRLRRQQEVEALLERYLESSSDGTTGRPLALLITKYDRVLEAGGPDPQNVEQLADELYGMTRHALASHVPRSAIFGVSSYGLGSRDGAPPPELHPMGLDAPLIWAAEQLEAIDREELEWIWDLAPDDLPRLKRCVQAFAARYPRSTRVEDYQAQLAQLTRKKWRRRLAQVAASVAVVVASIAAYDAWGYHSALTFERANPGALAVERRWSNFTAWHPTHPLFWPAQARSVTQKQRQWLVAAAAARVEAGATPPEAEESLWKSLEEARVEDPRLAPQVNALQAARTQQRHDDQWRQVQLQDDDQTEDPPARAAAYKKFLQDFPDSTHAALARQRIASLEDQAAARRDLTERQEIDALKRHLELPEPDLEGLLTQARAFLDEHPETVWKSEVEDLLRTTALRLDEAGIKEARNFSRNFPTSFATRRRKYEDYLAAHPEGGAFVREALDALKQIDRQRDVYTYRRAFDHAQSYPRDVPVIAQLLQSYLDTVPEGRYAAAAREYLAWWQEIRQTRDYRVTLLRGQVEKSVGKYLGGGGPNLGVELWVAGIKYGPSSVVPNSHDPAWNYTFRQPIRWKYGDPVVIRIIDFDWSTQGTGVYRIKSDKNDPLAMRFLSGSVSAGGSGRTELVFKSDFKIPRLPRPAS